VQENFAFNGHILTGSKEIRPRWKRCTGERISSWAKRSASLCTEIFFRRRRKRERWSWSTICWQRCATICKTLPWMSPGTRKAAIEKLEAFTIKIGYPDKWRDYSGLKIDRGP